MSRRIIAFPKDGNDYTELLYRQVEARGVEVIQGTWSARWLRATIAPGDLLHVHWLSFLYFDPASRARTAARLGKLHALLSLAKARGARILWTVHNLYPHDGGSQTLAHRVGRRIIVRHADTVLVHGASAAVIVARELGVPLSRLRVGHHGHWIGRYPNDAGRDRCRRELAIPVETFLYLFLGRCRPYKGLESLIQAFAAVPAPSRLMIAGKFSSQHYLSEVRALAGQARGVEIVAQSVPDERLQVYLNAADCVVLPYRAVLTSGAAMLAQSFGRPVVAPDLGSLRDHVAPACGVLYPADDPQGLSRALVEVRSRSFDREVILAHAQRFTWSALADVVLASAPTHIPLTSEAHPARDRTGT